MVTRKRKRSKSKTRQAEVLRDVEAETLELLERHGVRLSDAQRNFEAESTQIVPASELARMPFVLSDETRKYLSQHAPADSDTKEPSLGTKCCLSRYSTG